MIRSVRFKKDFRCFKKGMKIEFCPGLNLLVGDQGTGKSTIIELLRGAGTHCSTFSLRLGKKEVEKIISLDCDKGSIASFDFERDNPRIQSSFAETYSGMIAQLYSHTASHGETVKLILNSILKCQGKKVDSYVILDEPDTGLSVRSIMLLKRTLSSLGSLGCQMIVSAHNPLLIEDQESVFSVEHGRWMSGKEFIELEKGSPC